MSAFALLLTSCDPSTDDISSGFNYNVTAETVIAKATPVVVNGKNSNRIIVENNSPITCQWTAAQLLGNPVTSKKSYDTIYVSKTGTNVVSMTCHNLNGEFTKEFTVTVDEISYIPENIQKRLGSVDKFDTSFDPSKVSIEQETDKETGKKGNVFAVKNTNGVLTDWEVKDVATGEVMATSNLNSDNLLVISDNGEYEITLNYTKADGTTGSHSFGKYTIECYTNKPVIIEYLSGETGVSEWQWFQGNAAVWGNGPWASGDSPAWWTNNLDSMDGNGGGKPGGTSRNGINATFTLNFNTGIATNSDGTQCAFKVLPLKHGHDSADGWDKGCIHFEASGSTYVVPMAVNVNGGDEPFQDMYIVKAEDDRLNLTSEEQSGNWCAWFFLFERKK